MTQSRVRKTTVTTTAMSAVLASPAYGDRDSVTFISSSPGKGMVRVLALLSILREGQIFPVELAAGLGV
jgi:hypothetical protein